MKNILGFNASQSIYDGDYYGVNCGANYDRGVRYPRQQVGLNVYHFKITAWYEHGIYLVVKVNYPSAKSYEGNKVLVYEGVDIDELKKQGSLDPHFSENKEKSSPIARFEPTDQGWVNAMKFCSMLQSERLELPY